MEDNPFKSGVKHHWTPTTSPSMRTLHSNPTRPTSIATFAPWASTNRMKVNKRSYTRLPSNNENAPAPPLSHRHANSITLSRQPPRLLVRPRLDLRFKLSSLPLSLKNTSSKTDFKSTKEMNLKNFSTPLFQLVARRDWQMVLIRASMFPAEVLQTHRFAWDGVDQWNVLPLHLACALDPPAVVIEKLLNTLVKRNSGQATNSSLTATMTMTRQHSHRRNNSQKNIKTWLTRRRSHVHKEGVEDIQIAPTDDSSSIPSRFADLVMSSSSLRMEQSHESTRIIQAKEGVKVRISSKSGHRTLSWSDADALLPLHVACLYKASPAVIQLLCQANAEAARCWAWGGQLPIHMLLSQVDPNERSLVPPPVTVSAGTAADATTRFDDWKLPDALQQLVAAYPESVSIPSRVTKQTPIKFLDEILEDGINKAMCFRAVGRDTPETETVADDEESRGSLSADEEPIPIPLEVVCDQVQPSYDDDNEEEEYGDDFIADMASAGVGWRAPNELYSLMVKRKWECVYDMIEDDPQQAHQWQYGIEVNNSDDKKESLMWKRLPIHNCCRLGAPVAVLSIVLRHNPLCPTDPYTGALPIHLACQYAPLLETISLLLYTDPACVKHQDNAGRLPIHYACLQKNPPTSILQALLKAHPSSVSVQDKDDMTPLDYCCVENTDARILKTMKKLQSFWGRVERRKRQLKQRSKVDDHTDPPDGDVGTVSSVNGVTVEGNSTDCDGHAEETDEINCHK